MHHNYHRELGVPRKTSIRGRRSVGNAIRQAFDDIAADLRKEHGSLYPGRSGDSKYISSHGSLLRAERNIRILTEDIRATQV